MTEKILFAMVGASDPHGNPCGFLSQGMCVPLAATPAARDAIEAMGEDAVADWLSASDVRHPPAGGLWVLEAEEMIDDLDSPQGYRVDGVGWRHPDAEELAALLDKQAARRQRRRAPTPIIDTPDSRWVWEGALV